VPELMKAGLTVAFGHDCVMDPWYSMGSGDMLEVAHMGVHVGQMTSLGAMRACFAAVTENAAKILGLDSYGLAPGCYADMVVLQAADPIEAIRLKATRLQVIRRGRVIAETPAAVTRLDIADRPKAIELTRALSN
jgi:cytosine/creatinine deaminase